MIITLTDSDAEAYRMFQRYRKHLEIMELAGVFDVRRGHVEVHFDAKGEIGNINLHANIYNRDTVLVFGTKG